MRPAVRVSHPATSTQTTNKHGGSPRAAARPPRRHCSWSPWPYCSAWSRPGLPTANDADVPRRPITVPGPGHPQWVAVPDTDHPSAAEPEHQSNHDPAEPEVTNPAKPPIDQPSLAAEPDQPSLDAAPARPDDPEGLFRHALDLQEQGQATAAAAAYQRADELGHGGAAANLGVLHEQHGDHASRPALLPKSRPTRRPQRRVQPRHRPRRTRPTDRRSRRLPTSRPTRPPQSRRQPRRPPRNPRQPHSRRGLLPQSRPTRRPQRNLQPRRPTPRNRRPNRRPTHLPTRQPTRRPPSLTNGPRSGTPPRGTTRSRSPHRNQRSRPHQPLTHNRHHTRAGTARRRPPA